MPSQIAHVAAPAARWRELLLDLLFPTRCVGCHRIGEPLCSSCLSSVCFVSPPFCPRCGHTLQLQGEACFQCRVQPLHLNQIRAVAYHEGALRQAVHALKYEGRRDVAAPLAAILQQHLLRHPLKLDLITAVPLHSDRERTRGYNQAELLARELAPNIGVPYVGGLERIRFTQDQIGLNPAARHENVRGAFASDRATFFGKRVLLVDDVCTTGATLDACAVALRSTGARLIYGLTVTRPR